MTLNTGEQKDMAEFFIDLLSKMEEMSPEPKIEMRKLFCGTLTNNVVSLDCNHVSRTAEEFYTVRCQVSEMRNLYQSLEEVKIYIFFLKICKRGSLLGYEEPDF
jgi:ubiquitin carboxyl-terminal hydrolase 34